MSRRSKYILSALVLIWLAAMIALSPRFLAVEREKKNVERAFTDYSSAVISHDFGAAYQQCGSEFREAMPYDVFVKQQQTLESKYGGIRSFKEIGYKVTSSGDPAEWRGIITADLTFENGNAKLLLEFHRENGTWVVFGYKQI
jgi:hypothetical protein